MSKGLSASTLRKWKRDALETYWDSQAQFNESSTINLAEVKLLSTRLIHLADLHLHELSALENAIKVNSRTEKKEII